MTHRKNFYISCDRIKKILNLYTRKSILLNLIQIQNSSCATRLVSRECNRLLKSMVYLMVETIGEFEGEVKNTIHYAEFCTYINWACFIKMSSKKLLSTTFSLLILLLKLFIIVTT